MHRLLGTLERQIFADATLGYHLVNVFVHALRRLELATDVDGARKLGIKAVLKHGINNKNKNVNDVPVIHSIAELPDLIQNWPT